MFCLYNTMYTMYILYKKPSGFTLYSIDTNISSFIYLFFQWLNVSKFFI
jgi:hypothetical protein